MLKFAALLFNAIALLIYHFLFADIVTVTQNVPDSAKPGTEFVVELTINKANIVGFAKLQQDLPEGFTAVEDDNNGASFSFSNQSVKFIWMSLPATKEFKVKYKVKVDAGITSGDKVIAGKFSYVVDNVKQVVDITPSAVNVAAETAVPVAVNTTPATTTPDTAAKAVLPNTNTESSSITCVRSIPSSVGSNFIVEVSVNKGNIKGFAKLVETLPEGFKATPVISLDASFSFVDQKVKFVWVSLPPQSEFKVAYKVTVDPTVTGDQTIEGILSFIENDETKKTIVPASIVSISATNQLAAFAANKEKESSQATTTTSDAVTPTPPPAALAVSTPPPSPPAVTEISKEETPAPPAEALVPTPAPAEEKSLAATTIPAPQGNVNYCVQIAALHKAISTDAIATLYNINAKINTEMAEGYTKYLLGSHTEYKAARDAREEIKTKGVVGPFVTAYNNGKRITVQEALMITSQKWFK
jgi:hypothetical protein